MCGEQMEIWLHGKLAKYENCMAMLVLVFAAKVSTGNGNQSFKNTRG
jgi:hypothetical protein